MSLSLCSVLRAVNGLHRSACFTAASLFLACDSSPKSLASFNRLTESRCNCAKLYFPTFIAYMAVKNNVLYDYSITHVNAIYTHAAD